MADTYTTSNRWTKMALNSHVDTWDQVQNATWDMVEERLEGATSIVMAGGTTVLTTANNATDEARPGLLLLSGTSGTITIPSVRKRYRVVNDGTGDAVVGMATGTTVTINTGAVTDIYCDGSTGCTVEGRPSRGWRKITLSSAAFSGNSKTITLPVNSYTEFQLCVLNITHAAGANRDLQLAVAASSGLGISAHTIVTMTTGVQCAPVINLYATTSISSGTGFMRTSSWPGSIGSTPVENGNYGVPSTVTLSLTAAATFTGGTVELWAR